MFLCFLVSFTQHNIFWDWLMLLRGSVDYSFLLPISIQLYDYNTTYIPSVLMMDIWLLPIFVLLWIKLLWTFVHKAFCGQIFRFFLHKKVEMELLCYMVLYVYILKKLSDSFLKLYHFMLSPAMCESSSCSISFLIFDIISLFNL